MNRKVTAVAKHPRGFVGAQLHWTPEGATFVVTEAEEKSLRADNRLLTITASVDTAEPLTAKTVIKRQSGESIRQQELNAKPTAAPTAAPSNELAELRGQVRTLTEQVAQLLAQATAPTQGQQRNK